MHELIANPAAAERPRRPFLPGPPETDGVRARPRRNRAMLATVYRKPLHDLGAAHPRLRGVLSPGYGREVVGCYVTAQFEERAAEFVQTHQNPDHMRDLLGVVLRQAGIELPAEDGSGTEGMIYRTILADPRAAALPPASAAFWSARAAALLERRGEDKAVGFDHLDDKWMFTRSYFERNAAAAGFRNVRFLPL